MLWSEKYRPKTLDKVVGQKEGIKKLRKWIKDWEPGRKAALLYGPPGNGKTAAAYALANELNYELVELNASDFRGKEDVKKVLGHTAKQASLYDRGKLILIDEVDGISGRADRGGVGAVIDVVKESKFPVILTANNPWKSKLRRLRKHYSKLIEFGRVGKRATKKRLRQICKKEGIEVNRKVIKRISDQSGGDLRAAINNLQSVAEGKEKLKLEDLESIGFREQEEDVFSVLKVIFKTTSPKTAFKILRDSKKPADELFWWIEENIPKEYEDKEEVAKAYDALSKADIYLQRVRKRRYWRFKRYANQIMSSGVATAKEEMYHKFTRYHSPERLKKYGKSRGIRSLREKIAGRIAEVCHTSKKNVKEFFLPYLKFIFKKDEEWAEKFSESLDLSKEEKSFLG